MCYKIFLFLLFLVINSQRSICQEVHCFYSNDNSFGYSCRLRIQNPNGFNNFTVITGIHLSGMRNEDVRYITRSSGSTTNIPSIICETFQKVERIEMHFFEIKLISDNSFENCKELNFLDFLTNNISIIDENSFIRNTKLEFLSFQLNQINELPSKLFEPMNKLEILGLISNNLTVIHSDSFGVLPILRIVYLQNNQVNAIDEKFINNTGVMLLDMHNNLCEINCKNASTTTNVCTLVRFMWNF